MPNNTKGYPYKLARLVHYDYDLSKRWHVVFYAWDLTTNKLERKRLFEPLNRKKYNTVPKRIEIAEGMIDIINRELRQGKTLRKNINQLDSIATNYKKLSLLEAIDFVREKKEGSNHRKSYTRLFKALKGNVDAWLEHAHLRDFPVNEFSVNHAFNFSDFLTQTKGLSNKSHNTYKNSLLSVFNYLLKRDPKLFKINPFIEIQDLPVISRKHATYTNEQVEAIKRECIKRGHTDLLLFIQTMYYTLARPAEIIGMRISDIDLKNNKIFIPGENSKNRTDEFVIIPTQLKKALQESGYMKMDSEKYLFSTRKDHTKPMWGIKPMYERNKEVIKALGFIDKPHTLYSYKHTGAVNLFKSTKDIKLVQRQCRHKSIEMTNVYLRDLGILLEEELSKWTGDI